MKKLAIDQRLRKRFLPMILLFITLLMGVSLSIRIDGINKHNLEIATEGARNLFRMAVLTRQWNAEHHGIYVFVSEQTQPNPYLESVDRDLELLDHRKLTQLNPAYMTRQIAELAEKDSKLQLRLHITSLNPIRPANAPDLWEANALKQFEQGSREITGIEPYQGKDYLRYMAPLMVNQACLTCHQKQGYKLGDVRGGISVSLPFQAIKEGIHRDIMANLISHGVFYCLLIFITWSLIELLARRWRALDDHIIALQETRTELIETEKMASLGRLVAGFAHELNTPVGIAVGAISHGDETLNTLNGLIAEEEVSEQQLISQLDKLRESHQLALINLHRAAELVRRFKRTSIDCGSQQKRHFSLTELIQDVLTTLRNTLKRTNIQFDIQCPDELKLYGTPGMMQQVLINLINNSIDHGFDQGKIPGKITIKAWRTGTQRLIIEFHDNGVGMPGAVRQKAFEPFFTTNRNNGGSGLGLYIIYNIITQEMLGTIHITSSPNEGTTFRIECPLEQSDHHSSDR